MESSQYGLSRFKKDLPYADEYVCLGEGDTPCIELDTLARKLGLGRILAKMECQNPTGSYKDRAAAMSMTLAREGGYKGWIATSSGNAGLAMCAYGTRAGIPGFLCLVSSAPPDKRLPLLPYPVNVVSIEGVGRASTRAREAKLFTAVEEAAVKHGLYLAITAHAFNADGMRGIDTIAYELAEQAPDVTHVYVPTGGGGLLTAIWRGLCHRDMKAKLIACQPTGCAPIAHWLAGNVATPAIEACNSEISALQLPNPPDGLLAGRAVRQSQGWATAVPDEEILATQQLLASTEGIFVEPASAASLAALIADRSEGRIGRTDIPVVLLTGAGWKDLSRFSRSAERPIESISVSEISLQVSEWNRKAPESSLP